MVFDVQPLLQDETFGRERKKDRAEGTQMFDTNYYVIKPIMTMCVSSRLVF